MPKDIHSKSNVIKEFSRFAFHYEDYHSIQAKVAKYLIETLDRNAFNTIVDMGCGTGEVYKNIEASSLSFDTFIALDSSKEMLSLHPSYSHIEKRCENFNDKEAFRELALSKKDIFMSSSALQWSRDLYFTFSHIAQNAPQIHLALFTSATFKTLHKTANMSSPIYTATVLKETISRYYEAQYEIKHYRLHFDTPKALFTYIKRSGVSGGEKRLNFKETKNLMKNYPLDYLEFEVLFVRGERLYISD
jgi:malonyl-CoA O-methyltransferase